MIAFYTAFRSLKGGADLKLVRNRRLTAKAGTAIIVLFGMLLSACSGETGEKLTILEPPAGRTDSISLKQVDRIDGFLGLDWLSDVEMIGRTVNAQQDDKLSVRHLQNGDLKRMDAGAGAIAKMSPDRRFMIVFGALRGEAVMVSGDGKRSVPLSLDYGGGDGAWTDDNHYLTTIVEADGIGLALVGTDGRIDPVGPGSGNVPRHIVKADMKDDRLYVLAGDKQLFRISPDMQNVERIGTGIADFVLSPNGKRMAYVAETAPNEEALIIADSAGIPEGKEAANGMLLRRLSWSPQGDKLAFTAFGMERGMNGIYVMNVGTGEAVSVSVRHNVNSLIVWNPNGSALMVGESLDEALEGKPFTTIYRLQ